MCRILKRNLLYKKFTTDSAADKAFKKCNFNDSNTDESKFNNRREAYIDFSAPMKTNQLDDGDEKKPAGAALNHMINHDHQQHINNWHNNNVNQFMINNSFTATHPILSGDPISTCSYDVPQDNYDFFTYGNINWDELRSVLVDFALNPDDHL